MKYNEETKSERIIKRTALMLTVAIYFLIFSGIVFANRPDLLPETVKEWLNIEELKKQEEIKKETPARAHKKKKRA